ncbi:MAG: hypothetical protein OHK0039_48750 [Bacteroidia bacterium]
MLLLLLPVACVPPQGGTTPAADPLVNDILQGLGDVSVEVTELSRPNKVQAWVDKLVIKAQPGEDMPQVGMLDEGQTAEYLYQRTVRKTEFKLRGQRYYESWILIRTPAGVMGWVHEGGVRFIAPTLEDLLAPAPTDPTARTRGTGEAAVTRDFIVVPGKRVGPIRLKTTETELITLFGPASVARSTVTLPEGQTEVCTVVMPGTTDELRITWKDEAHTQIKAVYLEKAQSRWITPQGLYVGLPLSELTKVNKAPVSFYGFNWTYSGTVSSWRNGALAPYEKHFYTTLKPHPAPGTQALLAKLAGNQVFTSNYEGLEQLHIAVGRIVVYLD